MDSSNKAEPLLSGDIESGGGAYTNMQNKEVSLANMNSNERSIQENEEPTQNKMNTYYGVFQPCLLNIFGAIIFLRLSWGVGETGFFGVLCIFAFAGFAVTMTALSIAAISTNGLMKGGGAYFMISRCLGPELGGACGVMFYLATSSAVSFYLLAFAETVQISFFSDETSYSGLVIIATTILGILFLYANAGAEIFLKANTLVFAFLFVSLVASFVFLLQGGEKEFTLANNGTPNFDDWNAACIGGIDEYTANPANCKADISFNSDTLSDNFTPDDWQGAWTGTFIILFPSVTGIMAGANYSGDLADPGKSLGPGTLAAIAVSLTVYILLALCFAGTTPNLILTEDYNALQSIADVGNGAFVIIGVIASTISSALGQMVGSARVMQALAKDDLIPIFKPLAWGSKVGNEPRKALVLTWLIAQALILTGDVNVVAEIISMFYLLVYSFINLCCFALTVSGAPNFRPRFKYFSWHTAVLGFIANFAAMFMSNPLYASVAWILVCVITVYISYIAPAVPWGDISQALIYHQVRKYLLRLDVRKEHPKFWRPAIQLLVDHPQSSLSVLDFCNNLKKGGLYVISTVIVGKPQSRVNEFDKIHHKWLELIDKSGIKAFSDAAISDSVAGGFTSLIVGTGLGGMRPNTVIMQQFKPASATPVPFLRADSTTSANREDCKAVLGGIQKIVGGCTTEATSVNSIGLHNGSAASYVSVMRDVLLFSKNLGLSWNFHLMDKSFLVSFYKQMLKDKKERMTIDIWGFDNMEPFKEWDDINGILSLQIQLAYGLFRTDIWSDMKLRVLLVVSTDKLVSSEFPTAERISQGFGGSLDTAMERLKGLLNEIRVPADVEVVQMDGWSQNSPSDANGILKEEYVGAVNKIIRDYSSPDSSSVAFLPLPPPPAEKENVDDVYLQRMDALCKELPPTMLVRGGSDKGIMTTDL